MLLLIVRAISADFAARPAMIAWIRGMARATKMRIFTADPDHRNSHRLISRLWLL
jgi:hypothetical protein